MILEMLTENCLGYNSDN